MNNRYIHLLSQNLNAVLRMQIKNFCCIFRIAGQAQSLIRFP